MGSILPYNGKLLGVTLNTIRWQGISAHTENVDLVPCDLRSPQQRYCNKTVLWPWSSYTPRYRLVSYILVFHKLLCLFCYMYFEFEKLFFLLVVDSLRLWSVLFIILFKELGAYSKNQSACKPFCGSKVYSVSALTTSILYSLHS